MKVLFFTKGSVPTKEEREAAEKLGTKMFRNASAVHDNDFIEHADRYEGAVPESYKAKQVPPNRPALVKTPEKPPVQPPPQQPSGAAIPPWAGKP